MVVLSLWEAPASPEDLIKMKPCYGRVSWLLREEKNLFTCLLHSLPKSKEPSARSLSHSCKLLNLLPRKISQWKFGGGVGNNTQTYKLESQNLQRRGVQTSLFLTSLQGSSMHIWAYKPVTFEDASKLYVCRNVSQWFPGEVSRHWMFRE